MELRGKQQKNAVTLEDKKSVTIDDNMSKWGRVYINDFVGVQENQDQFYAHLISLLSPQLEADEIGKVDGSTGATDGSGIAFFGRGLTLNSGTFNHVTIASSDKSNSTAVENIFNTNTAEFRLAVYHLEEDQNEAVSVINEIPIHFNAGSSRENSGKLVDSYMHGNEIQLIFQDEYGKLSVSGVVRQDADGSYIYEGELIFRNLKDKAGNAVNQNAEVLGRFKVAACGFFTCQSN